MNFMDRITVTGIALKGNFCSLLLFFGIEGIS